MIIVSDTSVLTGLLVIDKLELLESLYERVIIPKVVLEELESLVSFGYDLQPVYKADWLAVTEPIDSTLERTLRQTLDKGEAAAIALAKELKPNFLAIDEKKGRQIAESLGIPIIGLIGILIVAKKKGLIERVRPLLDGLMEKAGFRISPKLYASVLKEVGEVI